MRHLYFIILISFLLVFYSCKKEEEPTNFTKDKITGYVQKGPFNNGTSILISELNSDFAQTGKNLTSNIKNNQGLYEIDNINFATQYVTINANGYYFNEISGSNSASQLTLYAISDLSNKNSLNINILSHLEKERVEYLLSTGYSFNSAKSQAIEEILSTFEIIKPDNIESELLDISQIGNGNSILLAVSAIFQGYRSTADLSNLAANFSTDIEIDGVLDNIQIQSDLITHAKSFNLTQIKENIENYYTDLGINSTIPDFETHIQNFIENSEFDTLNLIEYPEYGSYGENLLCLSKDTFYTEQDYSLAAELPQNGYLKIVLKNGQWGYQGSSSTNWNISSYNSSDSSQTFTSVNSGVDCDIKIIFPTDSLNENKIVIEYYEFGSTQPTRIKPITTID